MRFVFFKLHRHVHHIPDEHEAIRPCNLVLQFVDEREQKLRAVAHGRADVADDDQRGLFVPRLMLQFNGHSTVAHVGAERAAWVWLTIFVALLAQGRTTAEFRRQTADFRANLVNLALA